MYKLFVHDACTLIKSYWVGNGLNRPVRGFCTALARLPRRLPKPLTAYFFFLAQLTSHVSVKAKICEELPAASATAQVTFPVIYL